MGFFGRLFGKENGSQQAFVPVPEQIIQLMIKLAEHYNIKLNQSQVSTISGLQGLTLLIELGKKPNDPEFRKSYIRAFNALYEGLSRSMPKKDSFIRLEFDLTEYNVRSEYNEKGIIEWNELADLFALVNISDAANICREIFESGFLNAFKRNPSLYSGLRI
jgi:hypothetical protein